MKHLIEHKRRLGVLVFDAIASAASLYAAYLIHFEGRIPPGDLTGFPTILALLVPIRLACFVAFRLYRGILAYAGLSDIQAIAKAVAAGSVVLIASLMVLDIRLSSQSVLIIDGLIVFLLISASRLSWRTVLAVARNGNGKKGRPVLVIGAGDAAEMVLRELRNNPRVKYRPVGLLDDNPAKRGLMIHGVPVLGAIADVGRVAESRHVDEVIIAIPSADRRVMRRIVDCCRQAGVEMKTVPSLAGLLEGTARITELREVLLEDLLGREPARLDIRLTRSFLQGRRVMVTGAGGSIGSEIARQVALCDPAVLVLLERGENALFEIDAEMAATFPKVTRAAVLADIKHVHAVQQAFSRYRPDVVFDAAAFKHVPLMESHPEEAVLNNIVGTRRLAEVAIAYGTSVFVLISTDKAVNPTSVMGATKRAAERYIRALMADPCHGRTTFCAVRFGNVLGSSGSVIPTFRKQLERGGPLTVTHRDVARYFMTIPEAVQLVLRAATLARGGEIFVLDMGEPVRIYDMAHDMIRLSGLEPGQDIDVAITGLRPGEKLFEELWYAEEDVGPTEQDKLLVVRRPADTPYITLLPHLTELEELAMVRERLSLVQLLRKVVPEYQPLTSELLVRRKILVADDDVLVRDRIERALKEHYDILHAADGVEGLAAARNALPDLVLLDLRMPRVDGFSMCQALKADARTCRMPIIMLTGLGDAAEKVRGIGMGADDYITKPFDAEELKARIQMVLRRAYG